MDSSFAFVSFSKHIILWQIMFVYFMCPSPCTVSLLSADDDDKLLSPVCIAPFHFHANTRSQYPSNLLNNTTTHPQRPRQFQVNKFHPLTSGDENRLHSSPEGDTGTAQDEQRQHSVPRIKTCSLYLRAQSLLLQSRECIHFQDDEYLVRTYTGKSIMPRNGT